MSLFGCRGPFNDKAKDIASQFLDKKYQQMWYKSKPQNKKLEYSIPCND